MIGEGSGDAPSAATRPPAGRPDVDVRAVDEPDDPRLADYLNLRGPEFRRVWERQRGIFVAEGEKVVSRLLANRAWSVRSVLIAAERLERVLARLATPSPTPAAPPAPHAPTRPPATRTPLIGSTPACGVPVLAAAQSVIDRVTGYNVHRGVLAAIDRPAPLPWSALVPSQAGRLVVVEAVNDQENLGSLFRSAAALGADALLLSPGTCDPLYRRTVRVSMGAVFDLPFATVTPWPDGLRDLGTQGWDVVACTPAGDALDLHAMAPTLRARPRVALVVGAEGPGLTEAAMRAATARVRIAMRHGVDSLNVGVAAAIALHEIGPGPGPWLG